MGLKDRTYRADDPWNSDDRMLGTQPTFLNRLSHRELKTVVVKFPGLRNADTVLEPTPFIFYK